MWDIDYIIVNTAESVQHKSSLEMVKNMQSNTLTYVTYMKYFT